MKFNEKLQQVRKDYGYSQEDLAVRLFVTRQSVSKWESGASYPDIEKLVKISELFEISIDTLVKEYLPLYDDTCDEDEITTAEKQSILEDVFDNPRFGQFLCVVGLCFGFVASFAFKNFWLWFIFMMGGFGLGLLLDALYVFRETFKTRNSYFDA